MKGKKFIKSILPPRALKILKSIRARMLLYRNDLTNKLRYGRSAPVSFQRIYVDPSKIIFDGREAARAAIGAKSFTSIVDGDWDTQMNPIDHLEGITIPQRVIGGSTWRAAGEHARMLRWINELGELDGCVTEADIDARCRSLDLIIAYAKKHSRLKSASELNRRALREQGLPYTHI